eukprot:CAMPEP_0175769614 /NCGR_PEP_ID=MMETSP0097-20121207/71053_1 /TAXON_ID=311494 /ORGANISM="Alexandrium monilatum, Strain CCMP3105" /LENGTH=60 /DNA_ID=CAMNT_0017079799 /DNA_START=51 /DNA_END=230 /DNA_ORIENTATION=-
MPVLKVLDTEELHENVFLGRDALRCHPEEDEEIQSDDPVQCSQHTTNECPKEHGIHGMPR